VSGDEGLVTPQADWNVLIDPGDEVTLFGTAYFFERVDPDGAVTFRAPLNSNRSDFMVEGEDGRPRKPFVHEIGTIWREGYLEFAEKRLETAARRFAREEKLDADQARAKDENCSFRVAVLRRYDLYPCSKSDRSLRTFIKDALCDPDIADLEGARRVCPSTFRSWLKKRGTPGCRKERDGISMAGRVPRKMQIGHPLEIVMYWAVRSKWVRGDIQKDYDRYSADITKINRGEDLNRFLLIDPDGEALPCARPAVYPKPQKRYHAISYRRFSRLCRALSSKSAYAVKTTRQGAYQRFGGGGVSDLPKQLGAFAWMDDTPVPKAFFVDDETGIPVGQATLTCMLEHKSRVVVGWDLSAGGPSSATMLKTVLHANLPKQVPQDLLDIDQNLIWLRVKPGTIGLDNATGNHSRSAEDALADAYIGTRYFGSGMARDKSHMERIIGTLLDLVFKNMEGANYDIERMRRYKFNDGEFFDPKKHIVISIRTARRLLDRAVMTYNLTRHKGLDGRQPALVWKQELRGRKLDKIYDTAALAEACMDVEFDMQMTNAGVAKFNRRYTPGAENMQRILQQFDSGTRVAKGDVGHKAKAMRDDRKRYSFRVKGKYNREDIGALRIWNPFSSPPQWEIFTCTDPAANGTPLWLHKRCLELAEAEALEYATPEQQAYVRARLFEEIAKVDAKSAERERLVLVKAADHPQTRQVFSQYVEVVDEDIADVGVPQSEEYPPVAHHLALGERKDATIPTPRAKLAEAPNYPKMRPAAARPAVLRPARSEAKTNKTKTLVRRSRDTDRCNDTPRNAGVHNQPPKLQGRSAPKGRRSAMKWGEEF